MRIIHLSTWKEVCGIATYTDNLVKSLNDNGIINEIYPIKRAEIEYLSLQEIRDYFNRFCKKALDFDIVHIQHEHGFFHGSYAFNKSINIFGEILFFLKKNNCRVIVTYHTDPVFVQKMDSKNIHKAERWLRILGNKFQEWKWKFNVSPYFQSNSKGFIAISHTRRSRLYLLKSGFSPQNINVVKHGISTYPQSPYKSLSTSDCKSKLGIPTDSVLLSIFGFISAYKGYVTAISALKYLPETYKLAIIGGIHPNEKKDKILDKILGLVDEFNLSNRVTITGYVDFKTLDLYRGATDIFLAPYLPSTLSASGALTWALNSGKPVIASKIPSFYQLNQEADCMLMVTPEAPRELSWQIVNLGQDKYLQDKLIKNSLEYACTNSWNNIAVETIKIYKKMID